MLENDDFHIPLILSNTRVFLYIILDFAEINLDLSSTHVCVFYIIYSSMVNAEIIYSA